MLHFGVARLEEETHSWSCPCGHGKVVWVFGSPTAMYQRGEEVSRTLDCMACSAEWQLSRAGRIFLQHKSDLARLQTTTGHVQDAHSALVHDAVLPTVNALQAFAESKGRKAADWYSALQPLLPDAIGPTVADFNKRRNRRSLHDWLLSHVGHGNVAELADALGLSVPARQRAQAYSETLDAQQQARAAVRTHTYPSS